MSLTCNGEAPQISKDRDLCEKRKYNRWTSAEFIRLRKSYPTMTREKLVEAFAPHNIDSIRKMASQLKIRKRRYWMAIAATHTPVIFTP